MKKRIAVVGAGAADMAAAYLLQIKYDVTLFEAAPRLGGHAHSVSLRDSAGTELEMDVAFLVFNDRTCVRSRIRFSGAMEAEMSSCFSDPLHDLHFTLGRGLGPVIGQKRNLLRPRFWKMFVELAAFRKRAYRDLTTGADLSALTLGQYLAPYGKELRENFVLPLAAAIWSLESGDVFNFPAESILRYFYNHQLLHGKSEKRWRTLRGSSGGYVRAFQRAFSGAVRLSTPVQGVTRTESGVELQTSAGVEKFDLAVLATQADLSLKMLRNPTPDEHRLLAPWRYSENPVVLHTDTSVLHSKRAMWASWNMKRLREDKYQISYWLNRVQGFQSKEDFILSFGSPPLEERLVRQRLSFRHPIFSLASVKTQAELPSLNGKSPIYFCGSYFGHGFHEDAVASAVAVGKMLDVSWD